MLFQSGALFDSMNVFDNVAFPLREHTDCPRTEIADDGAPRSSRMVRPARTSRTRCRPTSRAA